MLLSFRQGLVQHEASGFLTVNLNSVSLVAIDTPTIVTIAGGSKDYLHIERLSVPNAWSTIPGVDQWLYWDISTSTGFRTFGVTLIDPVFIPQAPLNPLIDQHWFDTTAEIMKVWNGNRWVEKLRVFACKLSNGSVPISMSPLAPSFLGSQALLNENSYAGQIMFDSITGKVLKTGTQFVTTEDVLTVPSLTKSDVKFSSMVVEAESQQALDAYTVVQFIDFGKIAHADIFTSNQTVPFGIIQRSCQPGEMVTVQPDGAITNINWDWTSAGINAPLYCDAGGVITSVRQMPNQSPVAMVIDSKTILFGSPKNVNTGDVNIGGGVSTLDELTDVTITTPSSAQVLSYNGSAWVNSTVPTPVTNLDALTDVTLSSPQASHLLTYNGTTWVNTPPVTTPSVITWNEPDFTVYGPTPVTGIGNTVYGVDALRTNTTGSDNVAIGVSALELNNAEANTAIGPFAGKRMLGSTNTVIGYDSGVDMTGHSNVAVGAAAGYNFGNNDNVAIGTNAAYGNTPNGAYENVAIGRDTLRSVTLGMRNVAIGSGSMYGISTGQYNIGIGYETLYSNTTGGSNIAIGNDSLMNVSSGDENIAIGFYAGRDVRGGSNMVAIGSNSQQYFGSFGVLASAYVTEGYDYIIYSPGDTDFTLCGATDSNYGTVFTANATAPVGTGTVTFRYCTNTAVGYQTLYGNNAGIENTAIGYQSMWASTGDPSANIAIGYQTLYNVTSATGNVAIGYSQLYNTTTGSYNVALGMLTMYVNTTGDNNVALGNSTLAANTTGSYNVAVGAASLQNNTTGINNVTIGYGAGSAIISGSNNTIIGGAAGTAGMANNIVLATGNGTIRFQHDNTKWTSSTPISMAGLVLPSTTSTITLNASVGIAGQVLTSAGPGATPTWSTPGGASVITWASATERLYGPTATSSANSVVYGNNALINNTSGSYNTAIGHESSQASVSGSENTTVGYRAGKAALSSGNTAIGCEALSVNNSATRNTAIGRSSLFSNYTGGTNTCVGAFSLYSNSSGSNNVVVGDTAGYNNSTGSGNVFIGYQAGYNETGSNKLYIANTNTATPLLLGDFAASTLKVNGRLQAKTAYSDTTVLTISAGNVAVDASLSNNFEITATGNFTLVNPTNLVKGMIINFEIIQDATGSRLITYGTMYKFAAFTDKSLSTPAGTRDFMSCYYNGTNLLCSLGKAYQ